MNTQDLKVGVVYRFIVDDEHPSKDDRFILTRLDVDKNEADYLYVEGPSEGHGGWCNDLDMLYDAEPAPGYDPVQVG